MINFQRIIKYFAMFLSFLIIFGITSGVIGCLVVIGDIFSSKKETNGNVVSQTFNSLKIVVELNYADLIIKDGETLKLTSLENTIVTEEDNGVLKIKENNYPFSFKKKRNTVTLEVPSNIIYDDVKINSASGSITIDSLNAQVLSLDLGAGVTTINNMNIKDNCSVSTGAGKFSILNGTINNLVFDMGIGESLITALLTGDSKINSSIGELKLDVLGPSSDYNLQVNKGVGTINVNGVSVLDGYATSGGSNSILVNGDIGLVDISFAQN